MPDAIVVGSGPNGLAAAVVLARAGRSVMVLEAADTIGGGTHTAELTVPGVLHDVCSAAHPFGAASPLFNDLDLESYGLQWRHAEIDVAHPLDGGHAGVLHRSLDETAQGLGSDGRAWKRTFSYFVEHFDELAAELMRPIVHVPQHPLLAVRFGLGALQPATWFARRFTTPEARALFAGASAHVIQPLERPTTASLGLMFLAAGHRMGWPVAEGGSAAITGALARMLTDLGGTIETGVRVDALGDLPDAAIKIFDVAPDAMARIAGDAMPSRVRRAYARYRFGPAAFKVDFAIRDGIPWAAPDVGRAGTVHLGGTLEEIAAAEREVHAGRMPERPFALLGQQYLADPTRSNGDVHPIWAYCHVPRGYDGDATDVVIDQIERFAPGTRERIVAIAPPRGPAIIEAANANYVGGDIATGANDPVQLLFRPRVAIDPYATGIPGVYLCSAATPPGAGVHGMGGYWAATSALRHAG